MKKTIDITNNNSTDDSFNKNDLVLLKLSSLSDDNYNDVITKADCTRIEKNIIKNSEETFNSIYSTGKELFKLLKSNFGNQNVNNLIDKGFADPIIHSKLKDIFNKYVQENGFPYFIEDKVQVPQYNEFLYECIMIYLVDEMRRWNFKIKRDYKDGLSFIPTDKFESLYNILKQELVAITYNIKDTLIEDNFNKLEIVKILDYGLPINKNNEGVDEYTPDKFFIILQRSIILYIVNRFNGRYSEQYTLTKQLPVFNEASQQYRIYQTSKSLMGIAYNYLLLNLSATEYSLRRKICDFPECNNEFEVIGKGVLCNNHTEEEIRWYRNKKDYDKNYKNRKTKKAQTKKD